MEASDYTNDTEQVNDLDQIKEIGDLLPCFKCGKIITESVPCGGYGMDLDGNKGDWKVPYKATQFYTYGHYGSTFWDSFEGVSITINICDECCMNHVKLMRFKRNDGYSKSIEVIPEQFKDLL